MFVAELWNSTMNVLGVWGTVSLVTIMCVTLLCLADKMTGSNVSTVIASIFSSFISMFNRPKGE